MAKGDAWDWLPKNGPYIGVVRDKAFEKAVVRAVQPDSPAEMASIKPGDVIIRLAEREVRDFRDVVSIVQDQKPGQPIDVTIVRNEEKIVLPLIIGDRGQ